MIADLQHLRNTSDEKQESVMYQNGIAYMHYYVYTNTRIRWKARLQKRKFHVHHLIFLNKNMFIESFTLQSHVEGGRTIKNVFMITFTIMNLLKHLL